MDIVLLDAYENTSILNCLVIEEKRTTYEDSLLSYIAPKKYNMDWFDFIKMLEANKILKKDFIFEGKTYKKYYETFGDMQKFNVVVSHMLLDSVFTKVFDIWCIPETLKWFDKNIDKWQSTYLAYKLAK